MVGKQQLLQSEFYTGSLTEKLSVVINLSRNRFSSNRMFPWIKWLWGWIRNAISIGGDSDTIGAMTGAISEAFYWIPKHLQFIGKCYCPHGMFKYIKKLQKKVN